MMKTALILGGTSDVGIAIAEYYARHNYKIILAGRDQSYLERLSKDIQIRYEVEVFPVMFEATAYENHSRFYQELTVSPDVCICLFGYLGEHEKAETDWQECENILDVNYKGAVSILNCVAADFEKKGKGTIIGISSVAGDRGRQSNYFYGSAKAGFTSYLSGLRNRLFHHGVHVVTVKPGFIDTKMTEGMDLPKALTAKPEQVGRAVYRAHQKKRNEIYVLKIWWLVMFIIKLIPEFIFKRLKL